jgi:hypothetical protein
MFIREELCKGRHAVSIGQTRIAVGGTARLTSRPAPDSMFLRAAPKFPQAIMQQQNTLRSERRSTKPTATSKRHGRSSSGDADTTRSRQSAARSYRQTAMTRDDDDGNQANRRSKKDNRATSGQKRSGSPLAKRRSPVGGSSRNSSSKTRAQGSSRRAKQITSNNKGRTTPKSPRGSSAKRARSRR